MHILVVRNNSNSQAIDASLLLATYLTSQGIDWAIVDSSDLAGALPNAEAAALLSSDPSEPRMAVALGGDGTILRTARQVGARGIPILGINYGHLGFLANPSERGVVALTACALAGDLWEDRRANLSVHVVCEGERDPYEDDEQEGFADPDGARTFFALNELAVTRGANGRIIDFSFGVSGAPVAEMRGDGVVVATATGSTAYALSAGGPLVAPGFGGMTVVPIAPHALHSRAVVTEPSSVVELDLSRNAATREATFFVDGEPIELSRPARRVYVRNGTEQTRLLRTGSPADFYARVSRVFF